MSIFLTLNPTRIQPNLEKGNEAAVLHPQFTVEGQEVTELPAHPHKCQTWRVPIKHVLQTGYRSSLGLGRHSVHSTRRGPAEQSGCVLMLRQESGQPIRQDTCHTHAPPLYHTHKAYSHGVKGNAHPVLLSIWQGDKGHLGCPKGQQGAEGSSHAGAQ